MKYLRAAWRLSQVIVHLAYGLWIIHRVFPRLTILEQDITPKETL